jgi:hypothetical protein
MGVLKGDKPCSPSPIKLISDYLVLRMYEEDISKLL